MPRKSTQSSPGEGRGLGRQARGTKSQSGKSVESPSPTGAPKGETPSEKRAPLRSGGQVVGRKRTVDTESWVERNLDELIAVFHLDSLELSREEAKAIAQRLVEVLRGDSSTLDMDTIRRRFARHVQQVRQLIAQAVVEMREELTQSQLEFVANNIGEAVLGYAARLYKEASRYGREDIIETLRIAWRTHWTLRRYPMLPVECPKCRFNSLMPDLVCVICGSMVTEEELKKHVGFEKLLQDFVKQYSEDEVKKAIVFGYVYLNNIGLKPPTHERDKLDIEVLLSSKEKEYLKSLLGARGA